MNCSLKALFGVALLGATPAYSWWETGHRTVARLAAFQLTPSARAGIAQILNVPNTPNSVAEALALASTWADETKAQRGTGAWHYIDLALQDHRSDMAERCPQNNCVTARIGMFATQLASHGAGLASPNQGPETLPRESEADALRYLIHLVGDLHQPLHAVSDADLGGNCEQVVPPVDTAGNLHAVWDGAIVNAINPSDRDLAADLERNLKSFTPQMAKDLAVGTPEDWAWESHQLAIKNAYEALKIPVEPVIFPHSCQEAPLGVASLTLKVSATYMDRMKPIVREQLTKAGLRLGRLLNESF